MSAAKRTRVAPKALDCIANQKITIVNDVFGSPYHMISEEMLQYAKLGVAVQHSEADVAAPATLVPKNAEVLSFMVDAEGNTFAWHDGLYTVRAGYGLAEAVDCDSIVYGFAYRDGDRTVVRLFDACRLRGQSLATLTCMQRFEQLYKGVSASTKDAHSAVRLHWVWNEDWLHRTVLCSSDKFDWIDYSWDFAVRLPDTLTREACYNKILAECEGGKT
jgi:hypothetical protein